MKPIVVFRPRHGRFLVDSAEVIDDQRTFECDLEGITREVFLVPWEDPDTGEVSYDIRRGDRFNIKVVLATGNVSPRDRFIDLRAQAEERFGSLQDSDVCAAVTSVARDTFHTLFPGLFAEEQVTLDHELVSVE